MAFSKKSRRLSEDSFGWNQIHERYQIINEEEILLVE